MIDSLKTIATSARQHTPNDAFELVNKVDAFYNSAWDKLIVFGSIAFAIIGIVVPLVIQWYQKKTLKISEELLKKEIEAQTLKIKTELLEDINKTLEERILIFETKIEELNASSTAKAFHIQGNVQLSEKRFEGALTDFITAADNYIICKDYFNLQRVLNSILNRCLTQLSFEELEDMKVKDDIDLDTLLAQLSGIEDNGMFSQVTRDIRFKISKLPKTINEKIPQ